MTVRTDAVLVFIRGEDRATRRSSGRNGRRSQDLRPFPSMNAVGPEVGRRDASPANGDSVIQQVSPGRVEATVGYAATRVAPSSLSTITGALKKVMAGSMP